jgi:hypothetical protein
MSEQTTRIVEGTTGDPDLELIIGIDRIASALERANRIAAMRGANEAKAVGRGTAVYGPDDFKLELAP